MKSLRNTLRSTGEQHYLSQKAIDRDLRRNEFLKAEGWTGIRIRWSTWQASSEKLKEKAVQAIKKFIS